MAGLRRAPGAGVSVIYKAELLWYKQMRFYPEIPDENK